MCEEFALLAGAVSSRKIYSKNFRFYAPEKFKFSEDFPDGLEKQLLSMVTTHATPNDPRHLNMLFYPEY